MAGVIRTTVVVLGGVVLLVSACGDGTDLGEMALTCEEAPDPRCDNPVDRIMIPKLRARGMPLREAPREELCRRMALDLLHRIPSSEELVLCRSQTPAQMAESMLDRSDYATAQRRVWAEVAQWDSALAWWGYLSEADALAGGLARDEIGYGEFIGRLLLSPAYLSQFAADEWARRAINVALGRQARPDEVAGLQPLSRAFGAEMLCDGAVWWLNENSGVEIPGVLDQCGMSVALDFQPCNCLPESPTSCVSTTLGLAVDFRTDACDNGDDSARRLTQATPGTDGATCPDGSQQPECADRVFDLNQPQLFTGPYQPKPIIGDDIGEALKTFQTALEARDDFWEAAVDRELRRFVGWWQSGIRKPEWDVPEVRRVLAAELRNSGSLRRVHELLVTSLLYSAPVAAPPVPNPEAAPVWASGPLKVLTAEMWLDSAASAVGESIGICDSRYFNVDGTDLFMTDPQGVDWTESTLDPAELPPVKAPFEQLDDATIAGARASQYYRALAEPVGGCRTPRPISSSVGIVAGQRGAAQRLCAVGRAVVPEALARDDMSDAALARIADHVATRALTRALRSDERDALVSELRACLNQGVGVGCDDSWSAARWLCQRVIDSAEFGTY